MYKRGYCNLIVQDDVPVIGQSISEMKKQCEEIVLGIPDELMFARFFGDTPYDAEDKKQQILQQTEADDVLILSDSNSYEKLYERVGFDAVYYGAQTGRVFEGFAAFAEEKGIALLSMVPDQYTETGPVDALKIALENLQRHQKIILFGTGKYFDIYMSHYGERFRPAYATDNSPERQRTTKAGTEIFAPVKLREERPEDVLVIICAKDYREITRQLKELGDYDYRLLLYNNTVAMMEEYAISRAGELAYIEKAHGILAVMLKEFDRLCRKHQIRYYMICGSLIGVLRHQGFIPWDDDVDVAMPREDYERLRKIAAAEWQGTPYRILGYDQYGNGAFLDCMPRVVNMGERLPMKVYDKVLDRASEDIVDRPFLDIYVMDNAFDNEKRHMLNMNMMKGVYNLLMGHRGVIDYDEYRPVIPEKAIRTMKTVHTIGRHLPLSLLTRSYDHLSRRANRRKCENYFMPSCAIRCIERKFKQEYFGEGIRKPFLDFEVTVPCDCDGLMEAMGYHGYMQYPRMSIRKPSHYFNSDIIIW